MYSCSPKAFFAGTRVSPSSTNIPGLLSIDEAYTFAAVQGNHIFAHKYDKRFNLYLLPKHNQQGLTSLFRVPYSTEAPHAFRSLDSQ